MSRFSNREFLDFLSERFRIERAKFDRSGVYAYTQRLLAYNSNKKAFIRFRMEMAEPAG